MVHWLSTVTSKIRNANGIIHKFKYVSLIELYVWVYLSLIELRINYGLLLWGYKL